MNIVGENDQNSLVQGRQINDIFSPVIFVPGVWGQRHVDTWLLLITPRMASQATKQTSAFIHQFPLKQWLKNTFQSLKLFWIFSNIFSSEILPPHKLLFTSFLLTHRTGQVINTHRHTDRLTHRHKNNDTVDWSYKYWTKSWDLFFVNSDRSAILES